MADLSEPDHPQSLVEAFVRDTYQGHLKKKNEKATCLSFTLPRAAGQMYEETKPGGSVLYYWQTGRVQIYNGWMADEKNFGEKRDIVAEFRAYVASNKHLHESFVKTGTDLQSRSEEAKRQTLASGSVNATVKRQFEAAEDEPALKRQKQEGFPGEIRLPMSCLSAAAVDFERLRENQEVGPGLALLAVVEDQEILKGAKDTVARSIGFLRGTVDLRWEDDLTDKQKAYRRDLNKQILQKLRLGVGVVKKE